MGELLSAVSLILAMIGVVYSAWYPIISETLNVSVPDHLTDAAEERTRVNHALTTRARPLAYASSTLALILLPETWAILNTIRMAVLSRDGATSYRYDPVAACLILVTLLALGFAYHLGVEVQKLKKLKRRLTPQ